MRLREVHPRAVEMLRLRFSGLGTREIAERLELPVRLVRRALVELVQRERGRGRRVLVYATHTNLRDITPRLITDTNNQSRWEWPHNDPFGNNAPNENPSNLGAFAYNLRCPGQYFDSETGKHYNYFRDYDPSVGRYIQSDPIGLHGGINTYGYAISNPLALIDLFGLFGTQDFVNHYYYGAGEAIDLANVDLLRAFQNAPSVSKAVSDFGGIVNQQARMEAKRACNSCDAGSVSFSFSIINNSETSVRMERDLFVVGRSTFFRSSKCTGTVDCESKRFVYSCVKRFGIRDWFKDPLDIGIEAGGTPYPINADWESTSVGVGGF